MTLPKVTAVRFDRRLGSGRTKPCIIFAETEEHEELELVVKLAAGCELRGLICEAFASLLRTGAAASSPPCPPLLRNGGEGDEIRGPATRGGARGLAYPGLLSETPTGFLGK
jgi:hypothetical protein